MCHATDLAGLHWSGELKVVGQGTERVLSLHLDNSHTKSFNFHGKSEPIVANTVTDGTYSFTEYTQYLALEGNTQPLAIELAGLGAAPTTLILTVRRPAKSPVFTEPAMVGLCMATNVQAGSRFVQEPAIKENSK
ncbi:MAG: hypothetical protein M3R41_02630 [Pseudomonadota bacterium]|nr:hypothetical protein [Pseudomonadota bacterium]